MSKLLQTSVLVHDVHTELIVQPFADRILVLVTQLGKVGNLIQASIPPTMDPRAHTSSDGPESLPSPAAGIQLTHIFGSAPSEHMHTLHSLYAAQIATLVWLAIGGEPRSVIVGIALQKPKSNAGGELCEEDRVTFHTVMKTLQRMLHVH